MSEKLQDAGESKTLKVFSWLFRGEAVLVIGALLLMGSAFLGWVDRPIMGWLTGINMPISEKLPRMLSYGVLCFGAGLVVLAVGFTRFKWISLLAAGAAFLLSLHFILAYSFFDAKEIIFTGELNQQEERIIAFNNANLPISFMINPTFDSTITTNTIRDRLYATIHFSTFGWYAAVSGSLLIIIALLKVKGSKRLLYILIGFITTFYIIYTAIYIFPSIVAEYHENRGDYYLGTGMYVNAIDEYIYAMDIDHSIAYSRNVHSKLGMAYYFIGRPDMADSFIYRASLFISEEKYPLAIFYYSNANDIDPFVAKTAGNSLLGWAYVKYGLYEYKHKMIGSAIEAWKKSLKIYPLQIESYYYLCRAYYELGSYDESVLAGLQFMKLCGNKIREADMSSNLGDSYQRMQRYDLARKSYLKSLDLVMNGNQRALMSLVGRSLTGNVQR